MGRLQDRMTKQARPWNAWIDGEEPNPTTSDQHKQWDQRDQWRKLKQERLIENELRKLKAQSGEDVHILDDADETDELGDTNSPDDDKN